MRHVLLSLTVPVLLLPLALGPPQRATTLEGATTQPGLPLNEMLIEAAREGKAERVRALLDASADVNAVHMDYTALTAALLYMSTPPAAIVAEPREFTGVIDALLRAGADPAVRENQDAIVYAAGTGDEAVVKRLLEEGFSLHGKWKDGRTPLHVAARNGDAAMVRLLLEHCLDVEAVHGAQKRTGLIEAAEAEDVECVNVLLEAGADARPADPHLRLVLAILAAREPAVLEQLIAAGLDLGTHAVSPRLGLEDDIVNRHTLAPEHDPGRFPGNAAMHSAVMAGEVKSVRLLLEARVREPSVLGWALVNALEEWRDDDKDDIRSKAARDEAPTTSTDLLVIARLFLDAGMPAAWPTDSGRLAFEAAVSDLPEVLDLLLEHGGKADIKVLGQERLLEVEGDAAAGLLYTGDSGEIRFDAALAHRLRRAGIEPGWFLAAATGDAARMQELLNGAFPFDEKLLEEEMTQEQAQRTYAGMSLYFAIIRGHQDVVKMLLDAGADPNGAIKQDKDSAWRVAPPLVYAARGEHTDIMRLLINAGAAPNPVLDDDDRATLLDLLEEWGHRPYAEAIIREALQQPSPATRPGAGQ